MTDIQTEKPKDRMRLIFRKLALWLYRNNYIKKAIDEKADLSAFMQRPSARIVIGICLMALSYVLGWPAVAFLGVVAIILREPLIAVIGGPLIYGFSHLVFLAGFYLTGAEYSVIFMRWAARRGVEILMRMGGEKEQPGANMNT